MERLYCNFTCHHCGLPVVTPHLLILVSFTYTVTGFFLPTSLYRIAHFFLGQFKILLTEHTLLVTKIFLSYFGCPTISLHCAGKSMIVSPLQVSDFHI